MNETMISTLANQNYFMPLIEYMMNQKIDYFRM